MSNGWCACTDEQRCPDPWIPSRCNVCWGVIRADDQEGPETIRMGGSRQFSVTRIGPCVCSRCNSKNDYAEPNQKDGTYVCFECR
jgi:hypothetical protein